MPVRHWRSLIELRSFNFFNSMWDLVCSPAQVHSSYTSHAPRSTWFGFSWCCCYANDSWMVAFCRVGVHHQSIPCRSACPCLISRFSRLDCVCALLPQRPFVVHLNQATSPMALSILLQADRCPPKREAIQSELPLALSNH